MAKVNISLEKALPWLLIIGGIIATLASIIITVEKFDLIANPHYQPGCDLNPIISCGSVMQSPQAHALGFMNTYIGIAGFPILITVGVAMLAGATFKRWFWRWMQVGLTLGLIFAYWLLFESIFKIHALCPYCLTVDVIITSLFWYVLLYLFDKKYLALPKGLWQKAAVSIRRHHLDILILWFLIVIFVILKHFWYYFGNHLF